MTAGDSSRGGIARRGGIVVKTIRRNEHSPVRANGSQAGQSRARGKRKSKSSVRYREKVRGASRPGENFFADPTVASEFENRVLEIYAPNVDIFESHRELPLGLQAIRDGIAFRLPRLGSMCLNVVAEHFGSRVLPLLTEDENDEQTSKEQRSVHTNSIRRGIFGVRMQEEEDDEDFVADAGGMELEQHRSKRSRIERILSTRDERDTLIRIHEANTSLLEILPAKARLALQQRLEEGNQKYLTFHTLGKYFLNPSAVTSSKTCRILAYPGSVGNAGVSALLRSLNTKGKTGTSAEQLEMLHLQAHTRLSNQQLLPLFEKTSRLTNVNLRGCISVTSVAIKALVQSAGKTLEKVNLNWTGVGLEGVEVIIRECPNLQVLKAAHVQNLNESTVQSMMDRVTRSTIEKGVIPLGRLRKLKLRGTQVGTVAVGCLLKYCGGNLHTLDISDTRFGGEGCIEILQVLLGFNSIDGDHDDTKGLSRPRSLCKLNLSGLSLPSKEIALISTSLLASLEIFQFNNVHSLRQGGGSLELGSGLHPRDMMSIIFKLLRVWHRDQNGNGEQVLQNGNSYYHQRISLSNKISPTFEFGALYTSDETACYCNSNSTLIHGVKSLDISDTGHLHYYLGDIYECKGWSACQELDLSGCNLPENIGIEPMNIFGGNLRRLNLSNTKVTDQGVDSIIASNPFLASINLTSCRGVPVKRRRNYFDTD